MSFEDFQDGRHGGHLGYRDRTILAILNLYNSPKPPIKFQLNLTYCLGLDIVWRISRWPPPWILERNDFSNSESLCNCDASYQVLAQFQLTVWEEMSFEEFQDGGHLGYCNGTILAILNLYVAPMPPLKFRLNLTYGFEGDVVWRISRWPLWSERNDFSNSASLCHCHASHQVFGSIRLTVWEEMSFEEYQDGRRGSHLGYRNGTILAIFNLCVTVMPPIKFQLNRT